MVGFFIGLAAGVIAWIFLRYGLTSFYIVEQNERAVITSFGRASRIDGRTTLDTPIAESLDEEAKQRYIYPQLRVVGPGGPYLKMPWQSVHKINVAIQTINVAYDPENPAANAGGTILEAVTKDQLNIGITGQIRFRVCDSNFYAYLFGVKNPIAHVMGYFVSILRERIANFEAPHAVVTDPAAILASAAAPIEGISINDLRKNLQELNRQMDEECRSSAARYGIVLDASLITSFDPPQEIEAALAAINTAHNEVSAEISRAMAGADQKIEQSKRAVEIETMKAQAEAQPLVKMAEELMTLKTSGSGTLAAFVRNVRLELLTRAERIIMTERRS